MSEHLDDVLRRVTWWTVAAGVHGALYVEIEGAAKIVDDMANRLADAVVAHPYTALLWALARAEGIDPIDVGPCRVCPTLHAGKVRRLVVDDLLARPGEWRCFDARPRMQDAANAMAREGLLDRKRGVLPGVAKVPWSYAFRLACCQGDGRERQTATSLVLRCGPRDLLFTIDGRHAFGEWGGVSWSSIDGHPSSRPTLPRDHLEVLVDREQAAGRPWGTWVAQWLAGERGWLPEALAAIDAHWRAGTTECEECDETGIVTRYGGATSPAIDVPGPGPGGRRLECETCHGHGRVAA